MAPGTSIDRLGVHDSVEAVFPPAVLVDWLEERDLPVDVTLASDDDVPNCDAVVTFEHRAAFADLDWVHTIQAGYDRFPLGTFEERNVLLTNSTGIHGRTVGETVAGFLLAFSRRLHRHVRHGTDRVWERPAWDDAFTLPGSQLCVLGTGTLGQGIAEVTGSLGVEVVGIDRTGDPVEGFDRVRTDDAFDAEVAAADAVVAAVPLTDATRGLLDRDAFETMQPTAYVVNVSRGPVVDEAALIAALEDDEIAGAALDVFETEPLPEDSPLWEMDEVIVTPHCAAFTRDYFRDVGEIVAENVRRLAVGEEPTNRVV